MRDPLVGLMSLLHAYVNLTCYGHIIVDERFAHGALYVLQRQTDRHQPAC